MSLISGTTDLLKGIEPGDLLSRDLRVACSLKYQFVIGYPRLEKWFRESLYPPNLTYSDAPNGTALSVLFRLFHPTITATPPPPHNLQRPHSQLLLLDTKH